MDHMATGAEKNLSQWSYTGETRYWNFEKYASLHKEQHNILESLNKHGYTGIDQKSKVRYLSDRGFTEIEYVPKSRVIFKKNRWCPFCFFFVL